MKKTLLAILSVGMLFALQNNAKIHVVYKKRPPFSFRFPPQLSSIRGPVVMAKVRERQENLGFCILEMVKGVDSGKFYGWCRSKKIREYPTIHSIDPKNPTVPVGERKIEVGFNKYAIQMVQEINKKQADKKS